MCVGLRPWCFYRLWQHGAKLSPRCLLDQIFAYLTEADLPQVNTNPP